MINFIKRIFKPRKIDLVIIGSASIQFAYINMSIEEAKKMHVKKYPESKEEMEDGLIPFEKVTVKDSFFVYEFSEE